MKPVNFRFLNNALNSHPPIDERASFGEVQSARSATRPTLGTMIGHTDDETADGLLQPRLVDKIVPSKNPRMASMFLLVPCLLVVGWYGSIPSTTSSAATNLLAVAAGHTAWPKVAYGVSLGGCTLPHVEHTRTLGRAAASHLTPVSRAPPPRS